MGRRAFDPRAGHNGASLSGACYQNTKKGGGFQAGGKCRRPPFPVPKNRPGQDARAGSGFESVYTGTAGIESAALFLPIRRQSRLFSCRANVKVCSSSVKYFLIFRVMVESGCTGRIVHLYTISSPFPVGGGRRGGGIPVFRVGGGGGRRAAGLGYRGRENRGASGLGYRGGSRGGTGCAGPYPLV